MSRYRLVLLLFVLASLVVSSLLASSHSASAFKKLQSLTGDWEGKDEHGMATRTNFKVVASNTAVMETLSASGMEEMVSLYSIDQDSIALVHYCPTNNQPRMRATPTSGDANQRTQF